MVAVRPEAVKGGRGYEKAPARSRGDRQPGQVRPKQKNSHSRSLGLSLGGRLLFGRGELVDQFILFDQTEFPSSDAFDIAPIRA